MARPRRKTPVEGFDTGSALVETWIPDGGFEIRRQHLVPRWIDDELARDQPLCGPDGPWLHRLLAECLPEAEAILRFAGRYGLLKGKLLPRQPGKPPTARLLEPEPLAFWQEEIGTLRKLTGLWDCIVANERKDRTRMDEADLRRRLRQPDDAKRAELIRLGRERLGRELTRKLAGVRFDLTVSPEGEHGHFVIRYRATLIDALWQRFAEEIAGVITCARCPAPSCGRWFLRSAGRSDREYCSHRCRMRRLRAEPGADVK